METPNGIDNNTMTHDEALAALAQERERNARLKAMLETKEKRAQSLTLKVSEKGAVSVYGLGRFPITHYAEQWIKLFSIADVMKEFIEENKSKLSVK